MSSVDASTELLRAVHEDAVDQGRREGREDTMASVDILLNHSDTLPGFKAKWDLAKQLYREADAL